MIRLAVVLAVAAALAGASEAAAPRPLLLTQDGVAGVKPGITVVQVKYRLQVSVAGDRYGNDLDVAVCGPKVRGEALFHIRAGVARLDRIAFAGGVRAKEGIAPGSTFRALRRAYGKRLVLDSDPDIYAADADVVHPTHHGGTDLVFTVDNENGRVVSIGLGFGGLLAVHPVCAGATRGYAQFHSGDLTSVWFSSGVDRRRHLDRLDAGRPAGRVRH
jgi:hypothetical protein